jgi:hypothetical protein
MSKKIYKYFGPSYLDKVIESPNLVTLKCSYPKNFNDPYELFLTIDFKQNPKVLAFYSDVMGDIPQLPTTCFSRSPSVLPMWAHYAQNLEGFVIEFDETMLTKLFPESGFGDVDYQDVPTSALMDILYRAFAIGKPRYLYMLQRGVFSAAYYTKALCWNYEQERRMIVRESETRTIDDLILIDIPKECITALICGPRMLPEKAAAIRDKANQLECNYFEMKIGRTSAIPFFLDTDGDSFIFAESRIKKTAKCCNSCKEPLLNRSKLCPWCKINESHKTDAAERNAFRMMSHYGLLDEYIQKMEDITHGKRKRN